MVHSSIILAIVLPTFILALVVIILGLFMPTSVRDLLVKIRFNVVKIDDQGEVYVKNVLIGHESHRLLKCMSKNGSIIFILDVRRQAKQGLGTYHTFKEVSDPDAETMLDRLKCKV